MQGGQSILRIVGFAVVEISEFSAYELRPGFALPNSESKGGPVWLSNFDLVTTWLRQLGGIT
ncbi:MAG: hypothetical protein C0422_09765 [Alcaligenaceae bacterium]|nr:hypothetical protein [Alcaligenaceae bacterium]